MAKTARYAERTSTEPEASRLELDRLLRRYEADEIMIGHGRGRAAVEFVMRGKRVRMELSVPALETFRYLDGGRNGYRQRRTDPATRNAQEAEERRLWRVLILRIKARLEAIASESEKFEEAFLPYLLLPNGQTVADAVIPRVEEAYETGEMTPYLLPPPPPQEPR